MECSYLSNGYVDQRFKCRWLKNDAGYRLYLKDNGTWGAAFGDGNSRWYNNSSEHGFSDGQCHHLAATYDGDYIKLFEDRRSS